MLKYTYGMRLRPFAPMCQPMDGLTNWLESNDEIYHNILVYNRKLTPEELFAYELDFITAEKTCD